jgi:hypothetical protein
MLRGSIAFAASIATLTFGCVVGNEASLDAETQETIDNLVAAGFPKDDITVVDGVVYTGGDAVVSLEASREMLQVDDSVGELEQYRTTNLISRSLKVICVDGSRFFPFDGISQGLDRAIANYNELGLTFRMKRTLGETTGCNAVITGRITSGTGGVSGFPSGGKPFGTINIGLDNDDELPVSTIEHIITHELGHTIGFRHTDFFNRSISCGVGGNEGAGAAGAVHIPGTPTGATIGGSLMNACFRQVETGNFTAADKTALRALYGL